MRKTAIAVLLLAILLCGCSNVDEQVLGQPRLVTGIAATYQSGAIRLQRQYSDGDKMRSILDHLRLVKALGPAETDPETVEGSRIQVTLSLSDGSEKVYEQRADQYLRVDGGVWQEIPPEQGQELALLLGLMESD